MNDDVILCVHYDHFYYDIVSNFVFHDNNNAHNVYNDYWIDDNWIDEIFRFIKILLNMF